MPAVGFFLQLLLKTCCLFCSLTNETKFCLFLIWFSHRVSFKLHFIFLLFLIKNNSCIVATLRTTCDMLAFISEWPYLNLLINWYPRNYSILDKILSEITISKLLKKNCGFVHLVTKLHILITNQIQLVR